MAIIANVTTVNSLWLFLCNYNFHSRLSSFGRSTVSLWPLLWTYQNATSLGILDEFTTNFRNYGHIRTPSKIIVKSLYNLYKHNSHGDFTLPNDSNKMTCYLKVIMGWIEYIKFSVIFVTVHFGVFVMSHRLGVF